ncbi:MAG: ATP-dependent helicase [Parcubacteria group bacterium]|nr:ATP-dependent helicase [Parcubacteria group bacterium]
MPTDKFKELFGRLNAEQKEAVQTIAGPVMVIAGPGTGKTQILTLRIAHILAQTDAQPENILALTFTESAATNMRRRLVSIIGTPGYYVNIQTFHGFCNRLINDHPENFSRIIGARNINPASQIGLLRKIIEEAKLKHLKPFGEKFFYVSQILNSIKKLKNEAIDPQTFKKITSTLDAKEKTAARQKELGLIYGQYQSELARQKLYDFEDMILETVLALQKNKDFLLDLQEKHQYMLVDEHQDTNGAQNKALELLCGYDKSPNLFVVGDDKQAIFRFQGASLENFLYFKKKYPAVKLIELKNNYRSTQKILDASASLISHNSALLGSGILRSQTKAAGKRIKILSFAGGEDEHAFIAQKIKELVEHGASPQEIAVIYRENKDALPLADVLARYGLPYAVESDENILQDTDIKKINFLIKAVANWPSAEYLTPALHLDFLNLEPLEIYHWIKTQSAAPAVKTAIEKLGLWKKLSYNQPFPKFFETIIKDSGFLKNILGQPDYHLRLKKLNALFGEIKNQHSENPDYRPSDYLNYLDVLKEHKVPLQTKAVPQEDSLRLMTAHRAKGLEFETVFITGAYNGHWGNKRTTDLFGLTTLLDKTDATADKNEDERRLFYMALTRAKDNVFVTYSTLSAEGREQVPCQFINEIRPDLKEETSLQTPVFKDDVNLIILKDKGAPPVDKKEFVRELFLRRGLSPTSLNNYLACPWQFFYVNLLRIPQTQTRQQIYGTAKHFALQKFFEAKKTNPKTNFQLLTSAFTEALKKQPLAPNDHQIIRQRGLASLKTYHAFYAPIWNYNTINEFKISGVDFPIAKNQNVRLTGKLDKLEIQDLRSRVQVTVVDYKTRLPQSRNWILGKTKNSNGDYFRQLVFYKLLLDLLPRQKFQMTAGVIDFIESDPKDRFKKESFEITNADLSDIKDLIAKTANEILNLKFWNVFCAKKDCEYCNLRSLLPTSDLTPRS